MANTARPSATSTRSNPRVAAIGAPGRSPPATDRMNSRPDMVRPVSARAIGSDQPYSRERSINRTNLLWVRQPNSDYGGVMRYVDQPSEVCSISRTVELAGDRWATLILRDLSN